MKTFFTACLFSCILSAFGQDAKLNQFDANHKKDGKWLIYLDSDWKELKDSTSASYCRYTWYDHGTDLINMGSFGGKWKLQPAPGNPPANEMKLLDGEYRWLDKNGFAKYILVLKKGEFVSYKEFYEPGVLHAYFDYTRHWQGQAHSYYMAVSDKKGKTQDYFMFNGPYGWMGYATNADSVTAEVLSMNGDTTFSTVNYYSGGKLIRKTGEFSIPTAKGAVRTSMHGQNTSWYLNGQKKEEGKYIYGKKTGEWTHWDDTGKVTRVEKFVDGKLMEGQ